MAVTHFGLQQFYLGNVVAAVLLDVVDDHERCEDDVEEQSPRCDSAVDVLEVVVTSHGGV